MGDTGDDFRAHKSDSKVRQLEDENRQLRDSNRGLKVRIDRMLKPTDADIERITMAVVNADHEDEDGTGNLPDWSILPEWKRAQWRKHVRAAVAALRPKGKL